MLSLVSACSQARALSHAKAIQHEVKSSAQGARPQGMHEQRGASTVTVGQQAIVCSRHAHNPAATTPRPPPLTCKYTKERECYAAC